MSDAFDAIIIGSGPNGFAAAIELARNGANVCVLEAAETSGGGVRSAELTLPGFNHDVCSAVHPMGVLSPYFRTLPLEDHGLKWIHATASVAHPLDDEPAVLLYKSLDTTANNLDTDGPRWKSCYQPFLEDPHGLLADLLGPLSIPEDPLRMARFGIPALRTAISHAQSRYTGKRAQALFAGCAAHSILPLDKFATAAVGHMFALTAHIEDWPVAQGGSQKISDALAAYFQSLGGTIQCNAPVNVLADLPEARVYLFDTDPRQLAAICESILPRRYVRRLRDYNYGPGVYKLDWALDAPIPWRDPRCLEASTVHLGGTLEEIAASERAAWDGDQTVNPFMICCQQSQFDPTRAPEGKHTGYAYCHVPFGSTQDCTEIIEAQVERFAPGFRDTILARHITTPNDLATYNKNYIGGVIAGGAADLSQLFTRPVARLNPYTTPNPRILICSASTPPGGGVHGMCGYHAARAATKTLPKHNPTPPA